MALSRTSLSSLIAELLQGRSLLTAREIASELRGNPELEGLTKSDVNSVLYFELFGKAVKDPQHRWCLVPAEDPGGSPPECPTPSVSSVATLGPPHLLRLIQRLRAGTPPVDGTSVISVGLEHLQEEIEEWLDGASSPRWLLVEGNYGEGKSHRLALLREIAHQRGFATCQVVADAGPCALNHPQRFVPVMLETLEIPGWNGFGLESLLYRLLTEEEDAERVHERVPTHLSPNRLNDQAAMLALYNLRRAATNAEDASLFWANLRVAACHICGESSRHRQGNPDVREAAYSHLALAGAIAEIAGARGVVLLIDEVESVFSKMTNIRSRLGAYRVISSLCEGPRFAGFRVALALTPDARELLRPEIGLASFDALACEPVERFSARIAAGPRTVTCVPLSKSQRGHLLGRVRGAYEEAYPAARAPSRRSWENFVAEASRHDVPVRILVRRAVDLLDAARYSTAC